MGVIIKVYIDADWLAQAKDKEIVETLKEAIRLPGNVVYYKATSDPWMADHNMFWSAMSKVCPVCQAMKNTPCEFKEKDERGILVPYLSWSRFHAERYR